MSVAEQAGLNFTWSKVSEDTFLHDAAQTNLDRMTVVLHAEYSNRTWILFTYFCCRRRLNVIQFFARNKTY